MTDLNALIEQVYENGKKEKIEKLLWCCKTGDFEKAKSLFHYCEIFYEYEQGQAFFDVCVTGCLEMARWLYSLGNIDIHRFNDEVFRWSCRMGQFEVAKWLYSFGGIDLFNSKIEHAVISSGHKDVIEWFFSLKPN